MVVDLLRHYSMFSHCSRIGQQRPSIFTIRLQCENASVDRRNHERCHMDSTRSLPFDRPEPLQPPPAYAELRAREPVAAVTTSAGTPAWLVTSYDGVATVLSDPRFRVVAPGERTTDGATLLQDGEPHQRLRRLVGKAFTPRRIEALRSCVQRLVDEQIDALTASGTPADLVSDFAAPLSIAVIADLLGVEITERGRFRELADAASRADFLAEGGAQ